MVADAEPAVATVAPPASRTPTADTAARRLARCAFIELPSFHSPGTVSGTGRWPRPRCRRDAVVGDAAWIQEAGLTFPWSTGMAHVRRTLRRGSAENASGRICTRHPDANRV
ncbi:hypothetical protein SRO_5260 [Streptomyces rochei]|nr:hypothetical protein SRO_5260 [Streptomyces rochei]